MTLASQYDGTCPVCNTSFKIGEQIFLQKGKDGKWIKCKDEECFKQQGGEIKEKSQGKFTSNKFPITDATKIYNLAEELTNSFIQKNNGLPVEIKAQFFESMFKTLSGNFKP